MQLFVDGNIRAMNLNQKSENAVKLNGMIAKEGVNDQDIGDNQGSLSERVDLFDVQDIELKAEKECVLILAYSLTSGTDPEIVDRAPESDDVKKILGVGESNADYDSRIWSVLRNRNEDHDQIDERDIHAIARTAEYICSVNALPMIRQGDEARQPQGDKPVHETQECILESANDNDSVTAPGSVPRPTQTTDVVGPDVSTEGPDSTRIQIDSTTMEQSKSHADIPGTAFNTNEITPSLIPLPESVKSSSSFVLDPGMFEKPPRTVATIARVDPKEGQAVALVRNIMFYPIVNPQNSL